MKDETLMRGTVPRARPLQWANWFAVLVRCRNDGYLFREDSHGGMSMLKVRILAVAALVASVAMGSMLVHATEPSTAAQELVSYRLEKWKTTHAEGDQSDKLVKTLKTLRCEVKVGSHGGHTDVNYRCQKWQQLALKSHEEAHQWEGWLKKYGFETKHAH
ncbi:hypothetical protein [Rhodopirellula europaea]|jgi:hypothetical protein|uniref:Signal peptide protein n=1 Tax=Rhodopirellula europaea SH398 TaxID=1263868 RepID=M5SMP3_9BACT|nr:hypothetical protein [Rhodopirellula europaea]EMI29042.1 signal peptide protein [Rhodopirellula europaea SH398]